MKPQRFVCIKDYEYEAKDVLDRQAWEYYRSAADREITLKDNELAFRRLALMPSCLRAVSEQNIKTRILGYEIDIPICIAPTAFHGFAHPDGELATAKAAATIGTLYTMSMIATASMEKTNIAAPGGLRWMQCYVLNPRSIVEKMLKRAVEAGFKAIVLTVDVPITGKRRANAKRPIVLPPHLKFGNIDDESMRHMGGKSGVPPSGAIDASVTWDSIRWIKKLTNLPVVVKGILTSEDAILAVEHGAAAIIVSNHGGRQLDTVPATLDVLPEVVAAVGDRAEVYIDGGIRTGTDVLKALALGAKAVFIGRPVLWGLSCQGEEGARHVLNILKEELKLAMALSGCRTLADIKPSLVTKRFMQSKL